MNTFHNGAMERGPDTTNVFRKKRKGSERVATAGEAMVDGLFDEQLQLHPNAESPNKRMMLTHDNGDEGFRHSEVTEDSSALENSKTVVLVEAPPKEALDSDETELPRDEETELPSDETVELPSDEKNDGDDVDDDEAAEDVTDHEEEAFEAFLAKRTDEDNADSEAVECFVQGRENWKKCNDKLESGLDTADEGLKQHQKKLLELCIHITRVEMEKLKNLRDDCKRSLIANEKRRTDFSTRLAEADKQWKSSYDRLVANVMDEPNESDTSKVCNIQCLTFFALVVLRDIILTNTPLACATFCCLLL